MSFVVSFQFKCASAYDERRRLASSHLCGLEQRATLSHFHLCGVSGASVLSEHCLVSSSENNSRETPVNTLVLAQTSTAFVNTSNRLYKIAIISRSLRKMPAREMFTDTRPKSLASRQKSGSKDQNNVL